MKILNFKDLAIKGTSSTVGLDDEREKETCLEADKKTNDHPGAECKIGGSVPACFFSAREDFDPKTDLYDSLYCLRVKCEWSSSEKIGTDKAGLWCHKIVVDDGNVGHTFKRIPRGALVKNCPRIKGCQKNDIYYGLESIDDDEQLTDKM